MMTLLLQLSTTVHQFVPSQITTVVEFICGVGMIFGAWWNLFYNQKFMLPSIYHRTPTMWAGLVGLYGEFIFGWFMVADSFDREQSDLPPIAFTMLAGSICLIQLRSYIWGGRSF